MSLSLTEWRALHGIGKAVRRSDPRLAAALAIFTRLAADEAMPQHELLPSGGSRLRTSLLVMTAAVLQVIKWTLVTSHQLLACAGQHGRTAAALLGARCGRRHLADPRGPGQRGHVQS